jgi:Domain of unknown function (DUF4190)
VSTLQPGPGWWRASDGNWYAPETHPNYQPVAPPPPVQPSPGYWQPADGQSYPAQPQPYGTMPMARPPKTNGTAIASLVLSLVWLGGLGSLLAIIFGISSRSAIKKSQGQQTGEGLALAGLIIGILGLLGSALFYLSIIAVSNGVNHLNQQIQSSEAPTNVAMGAKVAVGDPNNTGITSVTVESLTIPVPAGADDPPPDTGKEYAAAKVEVCAGSAGSQSGADDFNVSLGFTGGQTAEPALPVATPDLGHIGALAANACSTGYVTFQIAIGTTPAYVTYQPGLFHQYRWRVPA